MWYWLLAIFTYLTQTKINALLRMNYAIGIIDLITQYYRNP